jgi:hypothetical protein
MAIKIISHSRVVEEISYYIFYEWVEQLDAGFMFPCNENGDINFNEMSPEALENYEKCESEEHAVVYHGLRRAVNRYREPAIGLCTCGEEVELSGSTNQCPKCSQLYNWIGQQLSDPENWGEETDEHPTDILREM